MDLDEKDSLWEEYFESHSPELRERLILDYAGLVKIVAGRMSMYLGYNVEYDDLVGYGVFGLIDAIDKYDKGKGVKFETYASLRIRGAILDQIRKMDWIPRTTRQRQRKIESAERDLVERLGRPPYDSEMAEELGLTPDEFASWRGQAEMAGLISLDDYLDQGAEVRQDPTGFGMSEYDSPEDVLDREELKTELAKAISELTDKEQQVIAMYYYEELTLKEISLVLSVSESRISQLHTKALGKLRGKLGDYVDVFTRAL